MIGEHIFTESFHDYDVSNIAFRVRELLNAKRQFTVSFEDGYCTVAFPNIGNRNLHTPQPQPPLSEALAA